MLITPTQTCVPLIPPQSGPVVAAWYPRWHARNFSLSDVSWTKYNTLIYYFVATSPDVRTLDRTNTTALSEFVRTAHDHGVAAHVAIGGWGGSRWFSSNVASAKNRTAFVQTITHFVSSYNLDGVNFDWEYPNEQESGCNTIDDNDTQNFLSFLQELRASPIGANLTVSAATSLTPFRDSFGHPSASVAGFACVLDYIAIMNYNVWGPSSPYVGPNAPLDDACTPPEDRRGSAVAAVDAWTAAGIPANQIVLGVPAYGHSFSVLPSDAFVNGSNTELAAYPRVNSSNQPLGDPWDDTGKVHTCGVSVPPGRIWDFWGLIEDSIFLTTEGNPAPGIHYRYDACSQTPYVYNESSTVMISFDNAESFAAKGRFIEKNGLRGLAMYEVGGDYHDILLDSIRSAAGYDSTSTFYSSLATYTPTQTSIGAGMYNLSRLLQ